MLTEPTIAAAATVPPAGLGSTALLRAAGLPIALWAQAGNPELFTRVTDHTDQLREHTERTRSLAEQLGAVVVPHPLLTREDRHRVLALRRRLHSGTAPDPADCLLLTASPAVPASLVREAAELCAEESALARTVRELEELVDREPRRAGELVWRLACGSPAMRKFLTTTAGDLMATIERRLARGEQWSGKALRTSAAFLWRAMGRAAAKTTPRNWIGQVAVLGLNDRHEGATSGGLRLLSPRMTLGAVAVEVAENVHVQRRGLAGADLRMLGPDVLLTAAPLRFSQAGAAAGRLRFDVIDDTEDKCLRRIELRRSPVLEGVLGVLDEGPRTLADIEGALLSSRSPAAARKVLRGFLNHLHQLGVLQITIRPRRHLSAWTPASGVRDARDLPDPAPATEPAQGCFIDSYRLVESGCVRTAVVADQVQRGVGIAARMAALREADCLLATSDGDTPPALLIPDGHPRPLPVLLDQCLAEQNAAAPVDHRRRGWAPPRATDSGYGRLLAHIADRADRAVVDIDDDLLDTLGAAPARVALPSWPLDCVLRPLRGPGPQAVLETASPAGVLDARFAETLRALHDGYDNVDRYREFLAAVERIADVRFVELLLPPLAAQAANAVRRPCVTSWWTGDPDPAPYFGVPDRSARHLPVDRITLRRDGDQVIAMADGRRIIPIHHATRSPLPPYDTLLRLLIPASHPGARYVIEPGGLAAALPQAGYLPRVTVGGVLVVCPAQWRVPFTRLWAAGDRDLDKIRTLTALRRSLGIPRFAFVRCGAGSKPLPVDFEAYPALRLVERLRAGEDVTELLVEEMLPVPGELPLRDRLHERAGVDPSTATQLLVRLPQNRGVDNLALAAAKALARPSHVPAFPAQAGHARAADNR